MRRPCLETLRPSAGILPFVIALALVMPRPASAAEMGEYSLSLLSAPAVPGGGGLPVTRIVGEAAPAGAANAPGGEARQWLRHPVTFTADKQPLAETLGEFAARQGVAAKVSPRLTGTVTGTFSRVDPEEFLNILCLTKQMNWYFDGGTAHFFSNSEMETRLLLLQGKSEEALRRTLVELGLYDSRFGWNSADDGRLLMIQGPEVYLSRVAEVLDRMGETRKAEKEALEARASPAERPPEKRLGVFRLRHAWAGERTVTIGDKDVTVPGVADILRQILSETALSPKAPQRQETPAGVPRLIKGTGVIGRAGGPPLQTEPEEAAGVPFIQADARINAVLVWDDEEKLSRYREIVATLDYPLELVEIRAAIVDVEADSSRNLGFNWEYGGQNPNWENSAGLNADPVGGKSYIPVGGDGFSYATIYKHGLDSFMARVNLMEKNGEANILSRPTVLTQDNAQAVLEYTDTFYVKLQGTDEVDLADIKTGLTLKVTPHVIPGEEEAPDRSRGPDGIQLAVHIVSGSNTADSSDVKMVDNLPRVKQSTITTQAVVMEGEALVIGGYYNERRSVSRTGVPFVSKIPGVGTLFRNKKNLSDKTERIFILSPRIVRPYETPVVPGSEGERMLRESPALEALAAPPVDKNEFQTRKAGRRP